MTDDPTARALELLALLTARASWALPTLAERLGVSERTVRRDVRRLRDLGYGVASTPGPGATYRWESSSRTPPLLFDDDELLVLVAGLRMAQQRFGGDAPERALAKLERALPRSAAAGLRRAAATTETGPPGSLDLPTVELLGRAAEDASAVQFAYVDRHGARTLRRVLPYRQVAYRGEWSLVAHDLDRDDWRSFRLDRVTEARALPGRHDRPDLPFATVAEYFATDFGRRG